MHEGKTCKKNISRSEKYVVQASFEKKKNLGIIQVKYFFPALILQRDNLGRDHILLKKTKLL